MINVVVTLVNLARVVQAVYIIKVIVGKLALVRLALLGPEGKTGTFTGWENEQFLGDQY